ncbi:MAG: GHKL domain-containing protein [Planctomycetes bacterium]|nr:GHKL domain-containing protein [Planctomycetota bacterium]
MGSLRIRLVLSVGVAMALLAGVMGYALHEVVRNDLYLQLDKSLETRARTLTALMEQDDEGLYLEWTDPEDIERARPALPDYFLLKTASGEFITSSPGLADVQHGHPIIAEGDVAYATLHMGGDASLRAVTLRFTPKAENEEVPPMVLDLMVAESVTPTEETLANVRFWILLIGGLGIVLGSGLLFLIVRHETAPLKHLARRIQTLDTEVPASRINLDRAPSELRPVVSQLNEMLERLEIARTREREFTAGAAHELRTPLAGIRAKLELALSRDRTTDQHRQFAKQSLEIAVGIQGVVERLLNLARLEAGEVLGEPRPVELQVLLAEAWRPHAAKAHERTLEYAAAIPAVARVLHPEAVGVVVTNLLENAVNYADEGGSVRLDVEAGDSIRFIVSNTGAQLSNEDAQRAMDPFWRSDAARRDAGVHAGLGLTLCRRLVEAMNGTFTVSVVDGRFIATVTIPAR